MDTDIPTTTTRRTRIVILGGGFGGAYCARELARQFKGDDSVEVVVLDRHNYFIFYPLLIEAGAGALQPRHVTVPIRGFLRHRAKLLVADVTRIDLANRRIYYSVFEDPHAEPLEYDYLVLALGSDTLYPNVPGMREHSYPMKSLADAMRLRDRAVQLLERANHCGDVECIRGLLRFVVVGGGPTGVETAGEFQQYLLRAAKSYRNIEPSYVSMTLVDHSPRILKGFDEELSDWAADHMRRRGIDLRLNESVAEVSPTQVRLGSGAVLPCHTTIWAAGIASPGLLATLDLPKDKRGYLLCEPDTRVRGHSNVWAIGDCASNPGPDGKPFPALAQHALGEGTACARNIARTLRKRPTEPVALRTKGMIAAFGHGDAVATAFGIRLTGFAAWFVYRTVYLMKMPGLGRKVRVAIDWTLDLFSRAEPTSLGLVAPTRNPKPTASTAAAPHMTDRGAANPRGAWETDPAAGERVERVEARRPE